MSKKDLTEYTRSASSLRACVDPYNDHFGGGTLVLGSDAECEIATDFMNAQESVTIQHTIQELGCKQPPTLIKVNNATKVRFTY